ncbi:hypothetical protein B0A58_08295 [Flavobacterium branchiophilum NBRC 15030 = ATCC 35035]|nr:hypothetical protein B0A58_08295 [Flavobacterium branchiophilum NBRC 15030 = ATCC 35035]
MIFLKIYKIIFTKKYILLFTVFCVRDSSENPLEAPQHPKGMLYCTNIVSECDNQKRLFHNMIFLLEFNERCLKRIARTLW